MKKLFGGINLTWKKLIIFAVIAGVYTALMALIPITRDTSFRDIAIMFEWWILFGIIIICNSKSPLDSALKRFVFFLISQPLVYLIQVPFSHMGWGLFGYYRYWFMWTLATFPMGYIGYYIKKKNILSVIILLPMLVILNYLGIGYFNSMIESFPNHLLSSIACFLMIIVIVMNVIDKWKYRIIAFAVVILSILFLFFQGGKDYETYRTLDTEVYPLKGEVLVTYFSGTENGSAEVIHNEEFYTVKIRGKNGGNYKFTIQDEEGKTYSFEYFFDKEQNTVQFNNIIQ